VCFCLLNLELIRKAILKKKGIKEKILKDLDKYKEEQNFAAQGYYLQLLIEVKNTPAVKVEFLSKFIIFVTTILAFIPFIIQT